MTARGPEPFLEYLDGTNAGPDAPAGFRPPSGPPPAPPTPTVAAAARPAPFLEFVDAVPPRLRDEEPALAAPAPVPRTGAVGLATGGLALLVGGFSVLGAANFVADQFARGAVQGALTLAVAVVGFGLLGAGIWREVAAILALDRIDAIRADLVSGDAVRVMRGVLAWAARVPGGTDLMPALRGVNDPDAALALLREGPGRTLREAAEAQARLAAVQTVAAVAAVPSPALDALLVAWRGTRLVRQVAGLYGVRPGLLGTLALLRRTALSAGAVGVAELAGNTLAHGLLGNPLLAKVAGEAAAAGVAARRMVVLGRAAATACDPVPRK